MYKLLSLLVGNPTEQQDKTATIILAAWLVNIGLIMLKTRIRTKYPDTHGRYIAAHLRVFWSVLQTDVAELAKCSCGMAETKLFAWLLAGLLLSAWLVFATLHLLSVGVSPIVPLFPLLYILGEIPFVLRTQDKIPPRKNLYYIWR